MEENIYTILNAIIPTYHGRAPKGTEMPYATYQSDRKTEFKNLTTWNGLYHQAFEVDIIDSTADKVTDYFDSIRTAIKAIERTTQGKFIQMVVIEESAPLLDEWEINGFRKILTFTVSYQN